MFGIQWNLVEFLEFGGFFLNSLEFLEYNCGNGIVWTDLRPVVNNKKTESEGITRPNNLMWIFRTWTQELFGRYEDYKESAAD